MEVNCSRQEMNVSMAALGGRSIGAPVVPPCNATARMDWSNSAATTTTAGADGRVGRITSGRTRSQAPVRADSFRRNEGRRMSQDTRRYMQAASASTQTTVQQLLARLQSYQTFQPFLSHPIPYTPSPAGGGGKERPGGGVNSSSAARQRSADRTYTTPQLWQMISGLMDTSVAHLLQHNAEDHFIATLHSTLGRELTSAAPKVRTVIESRAAPSTAAAAGAAAATASGGASSIAASPHTRFTTAAPSAVEAVSLVDRWAAEHPEATAADVAAQRAAWAAFEEKRRRDNGIFYLRAMQEQLDALLAEEESSATLAGASQPRDSCSRPSGSSRVASVRGPWDATSYNSTGRQLDDRFRTAATGPETPGPASPEEEEELREERERQRALWLSFKDAAPSFSSTAAGAGAETRLGAATTTDFTTTTSSSSSSSGKKTLTSSPLPSDVPHIVKDYLVSRDLHTWLQSSWPHRTHRHESAALRIQSAYRAYRARCEVRLARYTRRQSFVVGLAAEKEARRVWDMALQVQADASKADNSRASDATMRALQFFVDKINAVVAKRRARKRVQQEQEAEVRQYAAQSIQRVYRGHRARVYVMELRHPDIVVARQQAAAEKAATVIQTNWRRHREEHAWHRVRQAACTLQRAYRCCAAQRLLAERRRSHITAEAMALQRFAVHRIEVWYSRHLARRNVLAVVHLSEIHTLQRVSRGYVDRKRLGLERHLSELRAAAAVVGRRRRAVLVARAAAPVKAAMAAEKAARLHTALRGDAAVTIQRAWRSWRVWKLSLSSRDEL